MNPVHEVGEPKIYAPYSSPLTWNIESSSSANESHMVDLGAYGCRGECSCIYWRTTVGPKVKRGRWVACKHVVLAKMRMADWVIREFAKRDRNTKSENL